LNPEAWKIVVRVAHDFNGVSAVLAWSWVSCFEARVSNMLSDNLVFDDRDAPTRDGNQPLSDGVGALTHALMRPDFNPGLVLVSSPWTHLAMEFIGQQQ
jgi:hypothetical protein